MIIGTAGHIDHGKTSLVRALTGVETDRLKEEKARGISIELGFAYWPRPDGTTIGFVDVPGHEALVHNMLAGATGIDLVLLVVAADDGVMPQTLEHLAIMDLLGLERGVIALNKADKVGADRLRKAELEIRSALASTALADAPIIPVSAVTGAGLDPLRGALLAEGSETRHQFRDRQFRLAADRSFVLKGHGTAVTGLVLSGRIRVGDEIVVSPEGLKARVRSIRANNSVADVGEAGQRCALVLTGAGIDKDAVGRGDMILAPPLHLPSARLDAELRVLPSESKPLQTWFPIKFHHAASETPGRLVPLQSDTLAPGQTGLVQIVLERPIAACCHDRFVIRDTTSSRTIGGGKILDIRAPERRRRTPGRIAALRAMTHDDVLVAVREILSTAAPWLDLTQLCRDRALADTDVPSLAVALGDETLVTADATIVFARQAWATFADAIGRLLDETHAGQPEQPGIPRERLRAAAPYRLPVTVFNAALARLEKAGVLALDRSWVRRPNHRIAFSEQEENLWRHILPRLISEPFKPPRVRDIAKAMDIDEALVRRLSKMAARRGDVEEVAHDHFFTRAVVEKMAAIAADCSQASPTGDFGAAEFRDRLDNGRKVAIQILEYFDRHGFTIRRKDRRRINPHRVDLFLPRQSQTTGNADRVGGVPLPVGRPDFKSGWGRQTASGGFDSHPPPPNPATRTV